MPPRVGKKSRAATVLIRLRDKTCASPVERVAPRAFRCASHRRSARGATRSTGLPLRKPRFVTQPDKQGRYISGTVPP